VIAAVNASTQFDLKRPDFEQHKTKGTERSARAFHRSLCFLMFESAVQICGAIVSCSERVAWLTLLIVRIEAVQLGGVTTAWHRLLAAIIACDSRRILRYSRQSLILWINRLSSLRLGMPVTQTLCRNDRTCSPQNNAIGFYRMEL
jgi:hypothetical protein